MSYQMKDDILAKWDSAEHRAKAQSMKTLQKDISTARGIIADGLANYRKKKLRAKSKKEAAENPWKDLEDYRSERDIEDAYGWEFISEAEMWRLKELWKLREESKHQPVFQDRVTEMLEYAMRCASDHYDEELYVWKEEERRRENEAAKVARENNERAAARSRSKEDGG